MTMASKTGGMHMIHGRSDGRLIGRFRLLRKSDKAKMKADERKTPAIFRSRVLTYLQSDTAIAEIRNASYRIQDLGEFVGEMVPVERLVHFQTEIQPLRQGSDDPEQSKIFQRFLEGVNIGKDIADQMGRNKSGSEYRNRVVYPDSMVTEL